MSARLATLVVGAAAALTGCGGPEAGEPPAVDSTLVDLLADVHLADARAALDTTGANPQRVADSLRGVALRTHGLDSAALNARLDALAEDPELARATYDALDARLARERQGLPPTAAE